MATNSFLRNSSTHGSVNSASGRTEVLTRKPSNASVPVSLGLSGVQALKGVSGRVAPTNRAERRASDVLSRKQDGTTLTVRKTSSNGILSELWHAPVQPRVIKQSHVDVIQEDQKSLIDVILEGPTHGRWAAVAAVLDEWSKLEEGWDGEEAAPIAQSVIDTVRSFVEVAERYNVAEPRPFIASDGDVGFIWDGEHKASVSFSNGDRFLAYCPRADQPDFRLAGPLDVAVCSPSLFESLRGHTVA